MTAKTILSRPRWTQNPDAVRADILETATKIFAERGLSGARIDEIVKQTRTSKRMIYYYFGGKTGLYQCVLEAAYARVRAGEESLNLDEFEPLQALERLVEFTFDYHRDHPEYVRLVAIENIHNAAHIALSDSISNLNFSAIDKLREICDRGKAAATFRADIDPVELHWLITSSCVFNVSNRSTFSALYGDQIFSEPGQERLRKLLVRSIRNAVISPT